MLARPSATLCASICGAALIACSSDHAPSPAPSAAPAATASGRVLAASFAPPPAPVPAPAPTLDPNPLGLPPGRVKLAKGARVFTFADRMLKDAKPGSTLVLQAATIAEDTDGEDALVEGRGGPPYRVGARYLIAASDAVSLKPADPVITEHEGLMRHAVVTRLVKDRIAVRYTDLGGRSPEALLLGPSARSSSGQSKSARFIKQTDGLRPGNFAALRDGDEWRHVLLVSSLGEGGERRGWFALGYGGAARIVDEADLKPIPVRFKTKPGAIVWAEHLGAMRRATVQSVDDPGLFVVKFERAGRPATIGFGLLMSPIAD